MGGAPEGGRRVRGGVLTADPAGQRPFRVHVDPADDGAEVVNAVGDRVRTEFYRRIGLDDLLRPAVA
ncbi:hypothetical protein [Actinomycetospora sp. CA-084318]|uniref:hypothetical protein n=1 Tax=Actinomycetospora sp. CA-084318 TaxID=3239892 RepID=UPI003D96126A